MSKRVQTHKLSIGDLMLSARTQLILKTYGIKYVAELEKMSKHDLYRIPGIGDKSVSEIAKALERRRKQVAELNELTESEVKPYPSYRPRKA